MENSGRMKKYRRLSVFTDLVIIIFIVFLFTLLTRYINDKGIKIDEELSVKDLGPFEKNQLIKEKIKNEFGVNVIYGQESIEDAQKVNATVQEDEYIVLNNMEKIYNVLKEYPREYFNNLTIVILDKFLNNNIALASRNSIKQYKIYITNAKLYERSLNHEMYHVFEYMLDSEYRKLIDNDWYELNPTDFVYDAYLTNLDNTFVYLDESNIKDAFFVSKYSKVSSKEDRAEIFAEMMRYSSENQLYFNTDCHIKEKANYILSLLTVKYGENINHKWRI